MYYAQLDLVKVNDTTNNLDNAVLVGSGWSNPSSVTNDGGLIGVGTDIYKYVTSGNNSVAIGRKSLKE